MDKKALFDKAVAFHGHVCGGVTIGFQAALYAMELLDIKEFSPDEDVVCICENDACGVDAIQALLGCSAGKGNLLFRLRGKQAFSFFNRKNGKSVRLVLIGKPTFEADYHDLFEVKPVPFSLPEPARLFDSAPCAKCGEKTAEPYLRLQNGEALCLDCYSHYERFSL